MSHPEYSFTDCIGEIPDVPVYSEGVVKVTGAAVTNTTHLGGYENTEITLRGGAHLLTSVHISAPESDAHPKLRNNSYNTPDEVKEGSSKIFRVDIGDNVSCFKSNIISAANIAHACARDASRLNIHLRGTWSMSRVRIWGNVGFDLETEKRIPLGHLMDVHPGSVKNLRELGYPQEVPEIILHYVEADYSLWQLVDNFDKDDSEDVYRNTLNAAQQVLNSGCMINQFCAFKDAHDRPNCRCALYYPLLLEMNPLALQYFIKAGTHTRELGAISVVGVTNTQLEDALNQLVLARDVERVRYRYQRGRLEEPVKVVRRVTPARFEKFLKTAGIKEPKMLWRAP